MPSTLTLPTGHVGPGESRGRGEHAARLRLSPLRRFFSVVVDVDTYRNIAYLLLGLPLGVLWFTVLVTGASVSVSMLIIALSGIPMLLGLWYVARAGANVERGVANALLHQHLSYAPIHSSHRGNLWVRLRALSGERDRWREVGFLLLRFPVGVATFTAAATGLSVGFWVVWAPFDARIVDHPFGDWALSSRMEDASASQWSWLLVPVGVLLLVVACHLLNGLARACGRWTDSAIGSDATS